MKEKLIPVTSESQLRPGLLVEVVCTQCTGRHRDILLRKSEDPRRCSGCGWRRCGWDIPTPRHGGDSFLCVRYAIPDHRLFIVDTGLDEAQDRIEQAIVEHAARKVKV